MELKEVSLRLKTDLDSGDKSLDLKTIRTDCFLNAIIKHEPITITGDGFITFDRTTFAAVRG
jgi:hypothetical protein